MELRRILISDPKKYNGAIGGVPQGAIAFLMWEIKGCQVRLQMGFPIRNHRGVTVDNAFITR